MGGDSKQKKCKLVMYSETEVCTAGLIQFMEGLGPFSETKVCTVVIIQFMEGLEPVCETEVCTAVIIQFMEGLGPVRLRSVLLSSYSS